jgi:PucR-like helix-turn-helix protein
MAQQPWHELPGDVAVVLRPVLPDVADEIIEAVRAVPAYARPLDGAFGRGVRAGVQEALKHFLAEIEAGGPARRSDVYRDLGRGEMRAGRSLDSLLSAYRIGARVAWRRFAAAGEAAGLEPQTLYLLAESLFAYIDVLSAETAEGHALERSAAAGEAELLRRRLLRLLVRSPPAEPATVEAAALDAGWVLPRTLAALAISGRPSIPLRLPSDALSDVLDEINCVVVPDPDAPARRMALQRAVARSGLRAGLGTSVPFADAGVSFARARAALALADRDGQLVVAREHSGELLLAADPLLGREFAADALAPLQGLTPAARLRLYETLAAWFAEQGRLGLVARRLGVHPQTARYRLARLRELFGDSLDDPERRFWLSLALRLELHDQNAAGSETARD